MNFITRGMVVITHTLDKGNRRIFKTTRVKEIVLYVNYFKEQGSSPPIRSGIPRNAAVILERKNFNTANRTRTPTTPALRFGR